MRLGEVGDIEVVHQSDSTIKAVSLEVDIILASDNAEWAVHMFSNPITCLRNCISGSTGDNSAVGAGPTDFKAAKAIINNLHLALESPTST